MAFADDNRNNDFSEKISYILMRIRLKIFCVALLFLLFSLPAFLYADPPQFISFTPPDGATGVSTTPTLSWSASDPDPVHTLTYDIYFGTELSPSLVLSNQTGTSYEPGQIFSGTTYYWKIVARDNLGSETTGPILSFTTLNNPPQFISFIPPNGATGVSLTPLLSWVAQDPDPDDILVYDVYFGASSPPPLVLSNQSGQTYQPELLSFSTRYYWKIVARDNNGIETSMPELYFNTVSLDMIVDHS